MYGWIYWKVSFDARFRFQLGFLRSMMSRKLVIFAGALLCNAVVSGAMAAEPIKLRYGQNAAFAGSFYLRCR